MKGVVLCRAQSELHFGEAAQLRPHVRKEGALALIVVEGEEEVVGAVLHRENAAVVRRVASHDDLQVFDRPPQVVVEEVVHAARRIRPDAHRGFGDDAELAVAEEDALEELWIFRFGTLDDLAGRRHDFHRDALVGATPPLAGIDVDAADGDGSADAGCEIKRRADVIEALPPQDLGHRVPENPGLDAREHPVAVNVLHLAHSRHVERKPAERDGLALGGEPAAACGDRDAEALSRLHDGRDMNCGPRGHDAVRRPEGEPARVCHECRFRPAVLAHLDSRGANLGRERAPVLAGPARRIRLLTRNAE